MDHGRRCHFLFVGAHDSSLFVGSDKAFLFVSSKESFFIVCTNELSLLVCSKESPLVFVVGTDETSLFRYQRVTAIVVFEYKRMLGTNLMTCTKMDEEMPILSSKVH